MRFSTQNSQKQPVFNPKGKMPLFGQKVPKKLIDKTIFLTLSHLELSANSAFDYSTFSFAPSGCTITEDTNDGQSYDLFDSACENTDVDFSMEFDSDSATWKMTYVLFLFSSEQQGAYILSCDVDLCIASDANSACATMQTSCAV